MQGVKRAIVRNSVVTAAASLITGIVGFVMTSYLITRLGTTEYGLISLGSAFLAGYLGLMELGLQVSIVKFTAEYRVRAQLRELSELLTSTIGVFALIGIVTCLLGLAAVDLLAERVLRIDAGMIGSFKLVLTLIFASYVFQLPALALVGFIEGCQRYDILKGVQLAFTVAIALSSFLLVETGHGYVSVVIATVIGALVQFVVFAFFVKQLAPQLSLSPINFSWHRLREVARLSKYVFFSKFSSLIFNESDRFIIGATYGPRMITSYDVLFRLPRFMKVVVGLGTGALVPAASEIHASDNADQLRRLYVYGLRLNLFFAIPITTAAMFFAGPFLEVWVGSRFLELTALLRVLLLWNLLSLFSSFGASILLGMNARMREQMYLSYAITALKLSLVIALIRDFQLAAVVIANLVGMGVVVPFLVRVYLRELQIDVRDFALDVLTFLWPVGAAWAVGLVLARVSSLNNLPMLLLGCMTWAGVYWLVGYFWSLKEPERHILRGIVRSFTGGYAPNAVS